MTNIKALFGVLLFCLISVGLCSYIATDEQENDLNTSSRKRLRSRLEKNFIPLIQYFQGKADEYSVLNSFMDDIELFFIEEKVITEHSYTGIYDLLKEFLAGKKNLNNSKFNAQLINSLASVCKFCKSQDFETRKALMVIIKQEEDVRRFKRLADICFLFKEPVEWLVLSSKSYGHPEMFKNAPIILENIRKFFYGMKTSIVDVVLEDQLDFIRNSFDFNFSQYSAVSLEASRIHRELAREAMKMFQVICDDLKKIENPFEELFTGLGNQEIIFNTDCSCCTNAELWNYIISRVEAFREELNAVFTPSELALMSEISVIDMVIARIQVRISDDDSFTLEKANSSIRSGFTEFIAPLKRSADRIYDVCDEEKGRCSDIEMLSFTFEEALKKFQQELTMKIEEIKDKYRINYSETMYFVLSVMAVNEMAATHFKSFELKLIK